MSDHLVVAPEDARLLGNLSGELSAQLRQARDLRR
jgi:hypothetical protein